MGATTNDDDFNEEIEDIGNAQANTLGASGQIFSI